MGYSLAVCLNSIPSHMTDLSKRPGTVLILSQVYVPDPTSVGQHMAGAAAELVRRGWRVVVYTSDRGYDDPAVRYPRRELLEGVEVCRLRFSSFGKKRLLLRLLGGLGFVARVGIKGLFVRDLRCVLVSTSPPMCSAAALFIRLIRRTPFLFWCMDVNPDQAVQIGWAKEEAWSTRAFAWLLRTTLRRARRIVSLDRFMTDRLASKTDCSDRIVTLPPWPLDGQLSPIPHEANPFRTQHELNGKFVVMYSGNVGATSRISSVIDAAEGLESNSKIFFVIIGGGVGMDMVKRRLQERPLANLLTLPYQPLDQLRYSLSAADLHVVTMIDAVVGINHPCKVYGAMAVARPILFLGPEASHVGDLLGSSEFGWQAPIDDPDRIVAVLQEAATSESSLLERLGQSGHATLHAGLSEEHLRGRFVDRVEEVALGRTQRDVK